MMQRYYEATSLASQPRIKRDPTRIHCNDLRLSLRHWKALKHHAHALPGDGFTKLLP
jgi:hypothetical protein